MIVDRRLMLTYGLMFTQAISLAVRLAGIIPFISHTI